jgi:DNA primase
VVFCFDGDNAGRKAAWRALENALPVVTDGKELAFLFLPEGEDPDDFIRRRGKAAFEREVERATPLSEFLLAELAARHPPVSDEGRSALVAAARPLLGGIGAPVLAALIRHRLAALAGLPEHELRGLLGPPAAARRDAPEPDRTAALRRPAGRGPAGPRRRAPSLLRELIQCVLLQPELAATVVLPPDGAATPEAAALAALVAHCRDCAPPPTTPAVMQAFADSPHERVLADALATATDHGLGREQAQAALAEGVARLWEHAARSGHVQGTPAAAPPRSAEETERLRQLAIVRAAALGDPGGGHDDG